MTGFVVSIILSSVASGLIAWFLGRRYQRQLENHITLTAAPLDKQLSTLREELQTATTMPLISTSEDERLIDYLGNRQGILTQLFFYLLGRMSPRDRETFIDDMFTAFDGVMTEALPDDKEKRRDPMPPRLLAVAHIVEETLKHRFDDTPENSST